MNKLIESFFARKENVLSESAIEDLVRNQFKLLREESYVNMAKSTPSKGYGKSGKKELVVKYSFIPEVSVSELGWSSLKTIDGAVVPSAQRQQLFDYLKNIQGTSLADKVRSINSFYKKTPDQLEKEGFFKGESKSSKIQQIISYLVFLKTLTTIITNFNAASAGFAFESFLGVLLEGTQVPTNSGTIADLTTGDKIGISLKLYSESGVEVGGSFTDLSNDMINPKNPQNPFIRYIIAIKSLKGKGMDLAGEIGIFQFDINLDNIYNVMAVASKHSRECIRLPKLFISSNGQSDFAHLKSRTRTDDEVKEFFNKKVADSLQSMISSDKFENFTDSLLKFHENPSFWTKAKKKGEEPGLGRSESPQKTQLKNAMLLLAKNGVIEQEKVNDITSALQTIYKQSSEYKGGADLESGVTTESALRLYNIIKEARPKKQPEAEGPTLLAKGVELASTEESLKFYNAADPEIKKKALLNSQGYIKTMQFSMTKNQMMSVLQTTGQEEAGEIAKIEVGVANVEQTINNLASVMNQQVFEIFDNLSLLTSNINSYFATGMKDDNAADTAQIAAVNIDKKTGEIKKTAKS